MKRLKRMIATFLICVMMVALLGGKEIVFAANVSLTSSQIANQFNSKVGKSAPEASCLAFIANTFAELGATRSSACCAYNYGSSHIVSTSMDNIPVGADVFLNWNSNYSYTWYTCPTCKQYCHHVAVYVGDGYIIHTKSTSSGTVVSKDKLSDVIKYWNMDFRGWGYHGNVTISNTVTPTSVSLNKTNLSFTQKGATATLTATVSPSNATDKSVSWKSSNTSVATVSSSGVVTAVANGSATITATTKSGGKTATCAITVDIPTQGGDGWYYASKLPSNVTTSEYDIQYQNIYEKYATSSPGTGWKSTGASKKEYTKSGGTYTSDFPITTSDTVHLDHYYYYHYCSGTNQYANFVQTSLYTHWDRVESKEAYEYASYPDQDDSRYTYYHLKWNDGRDAYCYRGTDWGTCDAAYGYHGERSCHWYKRYVYQNYTVKTLYQYQKTGEWSTSKDSSATTVKYRYRVKASSVSLSPTNVTFTKNGSTMQLTATVLPSNAGDKSVKWKSSDTSVVTVTDKGLIKAVNNGKAQITVTTNSGGKTATCYVYVNIACTGVTLDKNAYTLNNVGSTVQLNATVLPANAANKSVKWSSSDTAVATVSETGLVTAKKVGTATITAACGNFSAKCEVTVKKPTTAETVYKIEYKLNGGTNNSANPTSYKKSTKTIILANPIRKGYSFKGWYSDENYKNKITKIEEGSTGDKILFAKWAAKKYTIKFNGNGSTSGKMSNLSNRKYGTSYKLSANKFKKKGYTFVGWNTKKDGSGTSYANKASVKNLSSKNGAKVTLYAQWKKTKYTITYKLNGGTNSTQNPARYYITTSTIKLKNPSRAGYTFKGWYSDSKFKNKVTKIKKGSTGNRTLYAKWSKNK